MSDFNTTLVLIIVMMIVGKDWTVKEGKGPKAKSSSLLSVLAHLLKKLH
jgi:hypothetical protein